MINKNKNQQLLLWIMVSFWCSTGSLLAQATLQPTVVWEMDNKSFLVDIQSVIPLDDQGNSLLLGYDTEKNIIVLEADNKGGLKEIGKVSIDVTFKVTAIQAISKDEVLLAGLTGNETIIYASVNLKTAKINWTKLLSKERKGTINALIPNKDGILLAGKQLHEGGQNDDIMLVYVNKEGQEQWYTSYGSDIGTEEILNGVVDNEGGFLLAAYADDFNANEFYAWVLRIDENGHNTWERKFGTPRSSTVAYTVCEGENGSPIFAGNIDHQIRITQLNKNHDTFWSKNIGQANFSYTSKGVTYSKDDYCYLYGNVYDEKGKVVSIYMTKLNGKKKIKPTKKEEENDENNDKKDDENSDEGKDGTIDNEKNKKKEDAVLRDTFLKFELVREGVLQQVAFKDGIYTTPNQLWDVGDMYEFYTTRPKSGHLYLFSIDGNRKTYLHYPRKGKEIITQSQKIIIPNADSSMILEVGGLEYLLAVYSQTPLNNIEKVIANLKKAKGPVRSGIIELLAGMGFQKDKVAYTNDELTVNLQESQSPIIPIIMELEVEKGQKEEDKPEEDIQPQIDSSQSDLHILSIGLNDAGFSAPLVEFAEKDAVDFTNMIKGMEKELLFDSLYITNILGAEVTFDKLKQTILTQNEAMKENDVCIIFLSLPFKNIGDTIRLLPSDFNAANIEHSSITYAQVVELLNQTQHKKIVLMDGSYDETLNNTNPNLVIINSASHKQPVFEHQSWENSAFTIAIIEAFSGHQEEVNQDNNNQISLKEVFDYIEKRVQALSKEKFSKQQQPKLTNDALNILPLIKF